MINITSSNCPRMDSYKAISGMMVIIEIENNTYIKLLEVTPINYNLKSDLEKEAILNSYKTIFSNLSF